MTTIALLQAMALVLWGFALGVPALGVGMALVRLALPLTKVQTAFSDVALQRLVAALFVFSVLLLVVFGVAQALPEGLFTAVSWLPLVWFALLLVEAMNNTPLRWGHFVGPSHRAPQQHRGEAVVFGAPFIALTVLSASVLPVLPDWFFGGASAVVCGWLFADGAPRGKRGILTFVLAALVAIGSAWGLAAALHQAQTLTQDAFVAAFSSVDNNPYKSQTHIGDLGRIKLSDQIVWRVDLPTKIQTPVLLRSGVFTHYANGGWLARQSPFVALAQTAGVGLPVMQLHGRGQSTGLLLPLPKDAGKLASAAGDLGVVERNANAIVRLTRMPSMLDVQVWPAKAEPSVAPESADLVTPAAVREWIARIPELDALRAAGELQRLQATKAWFASGFGYTLFLGDDKEGARDLERFLFTDRAGHCEYFATATVLLLRAQGIPARYVTGFALQEYSELEQAHLVRMSHAHAWAEAFVAGRWVEVDTTPSNWMAAQEEQAAMLKPLGDVISFAWYRLSQLILTLADTMSVLVLAAIASLLGLLFAAYLLRHGVPWRRFRVATIPQLESADCEQAASVKAFWALEREWTVLGLDRRPGETPKAWFRRVSVQATTVRNMAQIAVAGKVIEALYQDRYRRA